LAPASMRAASLDARGPSTLNAAVGSAMKAALIARSGRAPDAAVHSTDEHRLRAERGIEQDRLDCAGDAALRRRIGALHHVARPELRRWSLRDEGLIDLRLRNAGGRRQQCCGDDEPTHAPEHDNPRAPTPRPARTLHAPGRTRRHAVRPRRTICRRCGSGDTPGLTMFREGMSAGPPHDEKIIPRWRWTLRQRSWDTYAVSTSSTCPFGSRK